MAHPHPTWRRGLTLALAASIVLAACGDDTESTAQDTAATGAPATEAPSTEAPSTEAPATDAPATEAPAGGITVTTCGNELTFTDAPERVVVATDDQAEVLIALGVGDRLVATMYNFETPMRDDYKDTFDQLDALAGSGNDGPPSKEQIVQLEPDLVYAGGYVFGDDGFLQESDITGAGGQVFIGPNGCDEPPVDVFEAQLAEIETMGALFGAEDRAAELIAELRAELDAVATALEGVEQRRVLWVDYIFDDGRIQLLTGPLFTEQAALAGGELLFGLENEPPSKEQIAVSEPDVLLITDLFGTSGYETTPQERADAVFDTILLDAPVVAERSWSPMKYYSGNALGYTRQVQALAEAINPEAVG